MPVYAAPRIPAGITDRLIIDHHRENIVARGIEIRRQIAQKVGIAVLLVADLRAVQIDFRVVINAVEQNDDFFSGKTRGKGEMLPVPAAHRGIIPGRPGRLDKGDGEIVRDVRGCPGGVVKCYNFSPGNGPRLYFPTLIEAHLDAAF